MKPLLTTPQIQPQAKVETENVILPGSTPYSKNVKTNIGKQFINLIDKCFPPGQHLHKLLNRNTIKVSYSCMPNMKNIISQHNKSVEKQNEPPQPQQSNCNCRRPNECPLDNQCLTHGILSKPLSQEKTTTRQRPTLASQLIHSRLNITTTKVVLDMSPKELTLPLANTFGNLRTHRYTIQYQMEDCCKGQSLQPKQ